MADRSDRLPTSEKRFGNIAIEKGFIVRQQLLEAMDIQVQEEIKRGKRLLIGEILLDLDYMTLEQFEEVLVTLIKD